MNERSGHVTGLLQQVRDGVPSAASALFEHVYGELHEVASGYIRRERPGHILQPTALVNEAYLRLFGKSGLELQNREHFFRAAARAMRRILIDHARVEKAGKRGGGGQRVTLEDWMNITSAPQHEQIDLESALDRLSKLDERQAGIMELILYAGRTSEEIAGILGVSKRTVQREMVSALAWLRRELAEGGRDSRTLAQG